MRIMLIDDDAASRRSLAKFLSRQLGHEITSESSCEEALAKLSDTSYPLIITDIKMPGMDGISFLHKLKSSSQHSAAEVVLITGHASLDDAIEALRLGAFDYLLKPINIRQIAEVIQKVEKKTSQNRQEPEAGTARIFSGEPEKEVHSLIQIAGEGRTGFFSKEMRQIRDFSLKLHEHREIPVLIEGETGTGKEIIARLIHHGSESQDRAKPFVCFNCAAISPHLFESELFGYVRGAFTGADPRGKMGKLELAEGGTLFLDEIAEMPLEIQPKLLRVLQEREFYRVSGNKKIKVDIRVIGASNRDISELVDQNKFRRDLYYRINTARIKLPPLRERKKDILPLARLFLNELRRKEDKLGMITETAREILESHYWEGNVRELKAVIERIFLEHDDEMLRGAYVEEALEEKKGRFHNLVQLELPEDSFTMQEMEKLIAQKVLRFKDNNLSQTARYLGISRNRLKRLLS